MPDNLLKGLKEFHATEYDNQNGSMQRLVRDGQQPEYFIISCIDSRANPGFLFRPKPGTFFAHKAMGAIVRPYKKGTALSAALQFAIGVRKVPKLIIMGHTDCGAVQALVDKIEDEEIAEFVQVAQTGLDCAHQKVEKNNKTALLRETEKQIVLQSIKNIKTYPTIAQALQENRLKIKPWIFNMSTGNIDEYQEDTETFLPITDYKVT